MLKYFRRSPTPANWNDHFASMHSPDAVTSEYRARALEHHPDKGGSPDVFREMDGAFKRRLHTLQGNARRLARRTDEQAAVHYGFHEPFGMNRWQLYDRHMADAGPSKARMNNIERAMAHAERRHASAGGWDHEAPRSSPSPRYHNAREEQSPSPRLAPRLALPAPRLSPSPKYYNAREEQSPSPRLSPSPGYYNAQSPSPSPSMASRPIIAPTTGYTSIHQDALWVPQPMPTVPKTSSFERAFEYALRKVTEARSFLERRTHRVTTQADLSILRHYVDGLTYLSQRIAEQKGAWEHAPAGTPVPAWPVTPHAPQTLTVSRFSSPHLSIFSRDVQEYMNATGERFSQMKLKRRR